MTIIWHIYLEQEIHLMTGVKGCLQNKNKCAFWTIQVFPELLRCFLTDTVKFEVKQNAELLWFVTLSKIWKNLVSLHVKNYLIVIIILCNPNSEWTWLRLLSQFFYNKKNKNF